ncbi:bifunctional diguanylate cyclase/phosphodiesterase [Nitratiruptor sp. YY09-18]|uniref:putative bifunctional diguanylate cyclase/phosphodiesterase n=1 Tax=Nitratiruptor sp. YY09-18 TaxID=2724901 RepID=UPI0019166101|nr:EAL domain-containing protein [Nitratiruptor sp. YY09-18]
MKKLFESLYVQLAITFALFFVSFFIIYAIFSSYSKNIAFNQAFDTNKENIFLLKSFIEERSLQKDATLIERELIRFATRRYLNKIILFDKRQQILYANRKIWIGQPIDQFVPLQELKILSQAINHERFKFHRVKDQIYSLIPLSYLYNPITKKIAKGYLYIELDFSSLMQQIDRVMREAFLVLYLIITLLFLFYFFLSYRTFIKKYEKLSSLLLPQKQKSQFFTSIDELIAAQSSAIEKMAMMHKVIQNSTDGVLITDDKKRILTINPAFEKITGFQEAEITGRKPEDFLKSNLMNQNFYENMWHSLNKNGRWSGEIIDKRKDGSNITLWQTIFTITDPSSGKITNYVSIIKDISELAKKQEEIRKLALFDILTDLPNRAHFLQRLDELVALNKRHPLPFALLFIDIDNFKDINDTLGHDSGDQLLQQFAIRVAKQIRQEDVLARYGGDEFVVIAPYINNAQTALEFSCRIREALKEPFVINGQHLQVYISIGIALFPYDAKDAKELLKGADIALYKAKEQKDRCILFEEKMQKQALENITLKQDLEKAINSRDQLTLYLQPKIDLHTNKIVGFEALLRWFHPKKGLITPDKFIPLAEEGHLIVPLTEWIFGHTNEILQNFEKNKISTSVAINISAKHFVLSNLQSHISGHIDTQFIKNKNIEIEITESAIMDNVNLAIKQLNALHDMGIKIALDDFGTGYSSLQYLKNFPIDIIKIDRNFINKIPHDEKDLAIIKSTVAIAQTLGMQSLAEGIETKEQLETVKHFGVDLAQGYYFAKPMPFEETLEFIRSWRAT